MIKVESLNKYYNKNKQNEIHVINDTTLEFDNTGFISFLGASGSGKTTLLNTIGGLDKADKGSIVYDDVSFNKYSMRKMDYYRRNNIGYIFQNYLLLENETVYDNLKIALEIIDINDINEQKKRIEYALKAVGLYKFRKKLARNLSGGQMQRVSIARCLLKNSKLIIADEPTGNLDSDNAIEVMNILKKISKNTLVLLVTHSEELARFYSDRIIRVKDGKIIDDNLNSSDYTLSNQNDKKIWLKDLNNQDIKSDLLDVDLYYDDKEQASKIKIVLKNNTIYIESDKKVQVVGDSNIQLINDHYKHLEKKQIVDYNFDTSWFSETKKSNAFKNVLSEFKEAFLSFIHRSKRNRHFSRIFFIIGMAICFMVIQLTRYTIINTSGFSNEENSYIIYGDTEPDPNWIEYSKEINNVIKVGIEEGYIEKVNFDFRKSYIEDITIKYNAARSEKKKINTYFYQYDYSDSNQLLVGKAPLEGEVVLSKRIADELISKIGKNLSYEFLVGKNVFKEFIISGVNNKQTNSVYVNKYDLKQNTFGRSLYSTSFGYKNFEQYQMVSGRDIENDNELIIKENSYAFHDEEVPFVINVNGTNYTVVGRFKYANARINRDFITTNNALLGYRYDGFSLEKDAANDLANYIIPDGQSFINYEIIEGNDISSNNEAVVSIYAPLEVGSVFNGKTIVGKYKLALDEYYQDDGIIIVRDSQLDAMAFASYDSIVQWATFKLNAGAKEYFENKGYNVISYYDLQYKNAKEANKESLISLPIVIVVLLVLSIIYVYFSTKTKMLGDIKNISVLRSIGASTLQMKRKYVINIIVETTFTSLLGYILTAIIYVKITDKLESYGFLASNVCLNSLVLVEVGIFLIYIINIIFGLIPVNNLLKNTPSEINSKYDA